MLVFPGRFFHFFRLFFGKTPSEVRCPCPAAVFCGGNLRSKAETAAQTPRQKGEADREKEAGRLAGAKGEKHPRRLPQPRTRSTAHGRRRRGPCCAVRGESIRLHGTAENIRPAARAASAPPPVCRLPPESGRRRAHATCSGRAPLYGAYAHFSLAKRAENRYNRKADFPGALWLPGRKEEYHGIRFCTPFFGREHRRRGSAGGGAGQPRPRV